MKKNPMTAFLLSFIPGAGHIYMGRRRGYFYFGLSIVSFIVFIFAAAVAYGAEEFIVVAFASVFFIGLINMFDMTLYLIKGNYKKSHVLEQNVVLQNAEQQNEATQINDSTNDSERFNTILLSFIPGLGHFHLGLMNRGLTFLIGFFGLGVMIVFITAMTGQGGFMTFLGILPIIWIYNMFDSIQQLTKKQNGEELVDRTVLEDFEDTRREQGKKSKALATILSVFPGAGHMYLGLQKRGLQLMAAFLFGIYILDILRLSLFLFLIPLIWFYSFFDALQKVSKHGEEEIEDIPLVSYFINHQRWFGIGLLGLGLYYMFDNVLVDALGPFINMTFGVDLSYWYYNYFQTIVICTLLIGGGLKLIFGSKSRKEEVR
ncbi:hypothetical protein [Litchfieldia salsa]|uniref:Multi-TM2 domain-containing protein n=1 Tax=Litchfieldia salsa TaxID=930152 RepID=A0A1H0X2T6_9BACI|nr:hypothetical protein [Litchfieldia salsa]SDP97263.1 hypothetical protein SAMN05216565_1277 [Litchfieldia salsa]